MDINALEGGGYNVGKITAGEYLRYTVDVTADGEICTTIVAFLNGASKLIVFSGT